MAFLDVNNLLSTPKWRHISGQGMCHRPHKRLILQSLVSVLESHVEGDIVELGCHEGGLSKYLKLVLDLYDVYPHRKKLYLYDSFEGLPTSRRAHEAGWEGMETTVEEVLLSFEINNISPPYKIHKGWFKELKPEDLPEKIAFAFYDGDLYESIYDSFEKTYHLVSEGGTIVIHDYGDPRFKGVEEACLDFLGDKAQDIVMSDESAECRFVGVLQKK